MEEEKLSEFSEEDLEILNQKLMAQKDAVRDAQRNVQAELSKRAALTAFNRLSEGEKAAITQHIRVHALASEAKAGKV